MSNGRVMVKGNATWTCIHDDDAGYLWYIKLDECGKPPYRRHGVVEAIVDVAADGTVAGIEIVDRKMRGPPLPTEAPKTKTQESIARTRSRFSGVLKNLAKR